MSKVLNSNVYVIFLTFISGCADAISFLALGQVLTAAMTGNTVFLGLAIAHTGGLKPTGLIVSLVGFMVGALCAAVILRNKRHLKGVTWNVTATLALELLGFILFAIFVYTLGGHQLNLLIFTLAFSMGVQGAAARRIGVNSVPTTVITSMTTGLMESIVWNSFDRVRRNKLQRIQGNGSASPQGDPIPASTPASMMVVWVIVLLIYCVGAAVCGGIEKHIGLHAIWLPIVLSAVLVSTAVVANLAVRREKAAVTSQA